MDEMILFSGKTVVVHSLGYLLSDQNSLSD